MTKLSDVDHVFSDLQLELAALNDQRQSPRDVRRAIARFITLSQQLTEAMRREYSGRARGKWIARDFTGWNDVTELFKGLRNSDLHGQPLQILVHETVVGRTDIGALVSFSGTWELHDQHAESPPEGLTLVRADPNTGLPSDDPLPIVDRKYTFHFHARTPDLQTQFTVLGTSDVHELAHRVLEVLRDYYEFYKRRLNNAEAAGP
jgi:hypothetical protein